MSELVWAIKNGDIDQVKENIESSKCDVNKEIEGRPTIHYAADYGQSQVIQYLITKGADVNAKDKHGISALLAAVWEGHTECVRLLLEAGADRNGKAPDGTNYVDAADKPEIKALLSPSHQYFRKLYLFEFLDEAQFECEVNIVALERSCKIVGFRPNLRDKEAQYKIGAKATGLAQPPN